MEKEIREFKIEYDLDWEYGVEISEIRKDLDDIEKLGATHVFIDSDVSYDCAYITIEASVERLETDAEFKDRVDSIEKRKQAKINEELFQLEKLKKKYEK
jgi:hypothetical protein